MNKFRCGGEPGGRLARSRWYSVRLASSSPATCRVFLRHAFRSRHKMPSRPMGPVVNQDLASVPDDLDVVVDGVEEPDVRLDGRGEDEVLRLPCAGRMY